MDGVEGGSDPVSCIVSMLVSLFYESRVCGEGGGGAPCNPVSPTRYLDHLYVEQIDLAVKMAPRYQMLLLRNQAGTPRNLFTVV